MTRTSIRSLDPVDPSAPPPDGSRLLQGVLATPRPSRLRRRGVGLLRFAPMGLALATSSVKASLRPTGRGNVLSRKSTGSSKTARAHARCRSGRRRARCGE